MKLAVPDAALTSLIRSGDIAQAAGEHATDVRDLLTAVVAAPTFGDLLALRSVGRDVKDGEIILTMNKTELKARVLDQGGAPVSLTPSHSLESRSSDSALVIDDLRVDGKSLSELAG